MLITGAFGNVGKTVIDEAYRRGHEVTVFEVDNKKTRKAAKKYRNKIRATVFGDIRNIEDVKKAVKGCEAVIHLAAILPPVSKKHRELTMDVNYGGTVNLVNAIKETEQNIPLVFASSASVMGPTQLQNKPVDRNDPLVVTGNYEESKIRCEEFLRKNADNYLIFRFSGVLSDFSLTAFSGSLSMLEELFDMHPDMRLEMVAAADIVTALMNGAEKLKAGTTPKNEAYILAGGEKNGWRLTGREFLFRLFGALSLPVPDRKYFTQNINTYHLDWYDTTDAQREFCFQNSRIDDYFEHTRKKLRIFKLPMRLLRGRIMKKIVETSPYQ